ncbi:hypothetical protein K438DRAFT_1747187 [Mycena galopus ATCC 62051]|nr:hypothetical protein K438DRAFT_1747187 [Mycena galopus ATCC 62051]
MDQVYTVLGGNDPGVFERTHPDVQNQVHDHWFAEYRRFESIKEALIYMILKGDSRAMEQLNLFPKNSLSMALPTRSTTVQDNTAPVHKKPPIPLVHSHIRDFTGIIDTVYGSTSGTSVYDEVPWGKQAGYYLQAQGYTGEVIEEIRETWHESKGSMENFVNALAS